MSGFNTTYTGDTSVTIPFNAYSIEVEIAGAQGGSGGSDANGPGRGGGQGRKCVIFFPDFQARTLTFRIGQQGGNGWGCVRNSGAGAAGPSNVAGGGGGGRSGPRGCSGGGGGGGGASAIFDSVKNGYVCVVGGGGGGGGGSWNRGAVTNPSGSFAKGLYSGNINTISGGGGGSNCPSDGGGGGGGGGGAGGRAGGTHGFDNNVGGMDGIGGNSAFDSNYVSFTSNSGTSNFGNGYAKLTYTLANPILNSFTADPNPIISGQSTTLSWDTTFGNLSGGYIDNGVGAISFDANGNGSTTVSPTTTTSYVIGLYNIPNNGGTYVTGIVTVTVYQPPQVFITASPSTQIIAGACVNLSWYVTGDGDTVYWTSGGLTNQNITSNETVCPGDTTTYCAYTSGNGGTSDETCITIEVYQIPTLSVNWPSSLSYGNQGVIEYTANYANTSVELFATYSFYDAPDQSVGPISLTASSSPFLNVAGASVTDTYNTQIPFDNRGAKTVSFTIIATGNGGSISDSQTINVAIDRTPDNLNIPESDEKIKEEEPVVVPETPVLTDLFLINDVDIDVEIQANYPIEVDVNQADNWQSVREIGSVSGNSFMGEDPNEGIVAANNHSFHLAQSDTFSTDTFYSDDPNEEAPLISKITNAQLAQLINCISIIDEVSPSVSTQQSDWTAFRNNFPYRTFWLLQAVIESNGNIRYPLSRLNMPSNYLNDPYANGGIQVRRDNNNANFTSSWFDICNLANVPDGTYVSLWIDISGSMVFNTIQASYNEFVADCAANNVNIILETSDSGERWIPGHNKTLPPSANFKIIDSNGQAVNSVTVLAGSSVTLAWIVFGDVTNLTITPDVINTSNSNFFYASTTVNPTQNTTYLLTATGPEGDTNISVQVNVLTPPTLFISANPSGTIITGNCTTLDWYVTGDADQIIWTQGNINNGNLTSNSTVCPGDTTTYCAKATGIAGDSPETCITVTVAQFPTCSIDSPATTTYGQSTFDVEYETQYANGTIQIVPEYVYLDGTTSVGTAIDITPATSAELGGTQGSTDRDGTIDWVTIGVPWNNFGPYLINWTISVTGTGGTAQDSTTTSVIIDQTPDNFVIPESKDKFKEQEPVETPETEVLSELLLVDGIDIPVEIKANYPLLVDKNLEDNWQGVREL